MRKTIHICMLGSDLSVRGGMSSVVSRLLKHQWQENVKIEYIPTHESASVLRRCLVFAKGYLRLLRRLTGGKVDLVDLHMSQRGSFYRKYFLYHLAKRHHVKVILHLHGSEFMEYYKASSLGTKRRIEQMLRGCDSVLVLGKNWARRIRSIEPRTRLRILHNAVSLPEESAQWNEERTELCYLGVLVPRKGIGDLLQAMQILISGNTLLRPIHLTVAGSGEDLQRLEEMCRELNLEQYVTFAGWVDDRIKHAYLMRSQCFILPSYNEGLPVGILEALSYGLPTVSTDVGSVDEAVHDGENGRLVEAGDPEALANAINWTVSHKELWHRLSNNAKATAYRDFDERVVFSRLETLYFSLCEEENL